MISTIFEIGRIPIVHRRRCNQSGESLTVTFLTTRTAYLDANSAGAVASITSLVCSSVSFNSKAGRVGSSERIAATSHAVPFIENRSARLGVIPVSNTSSSKPSTVKASSPGCRSAASISLNTQIPSSKSFGATLSSKPSSCKAANIPFDNSPRNLPLRIFLLSPITEPCLAKTTVCPSATFGAPVTT